MQLTHNITYWYPYTNVSYVNKYLRTTKIIFSEGDYNYLTQKENKMLAIMYRMKRTKITLASEYLNTRT